MKINIKEKQGFKMNNHFFFLDETIKSNEIVEMNKIKNVVALQ